MPKPCPISSLRLESSVGCQEIVSELTDILPTEFLFLSATVVLGYSHSALPNSRCSAFPRAAPKSRSIKNDCRKTGARCAERPKISSIYTRVSSSWRERTVFWSQLSLIAGRLGRIPIHEQPSTPPCAGCDLPVGLGQHFCRTCGAKTRFDSLEYRQTCSLGGGARSSHL
jgi:hypothetical protein